MEEEQRKYPRDFFEHVLYWGMFGYVVITIISIILYPFFSLKKYPDFSSGFYANLYESFQAGIRMVHDYWRASVVVVLLVFYRPIYKALMEIKLWYPKEPQKIPKDPDSQRTSEKEPLTVLEQKVPKAQEPPS